MRLQRISVGRDVLEGERVMLNDWLLRRAPLAGTDPPGRDACAMDKVWKAGLPPAVPNSVPTQSCRVPLQARGTHCWTQPRPWLPFQTFRMLTRAWLDVRLCDSNPKVSALRLSQPSVCDIMRDRHTEEKLQAR